MKLTGVKVLMKELLKVKKKYEKVAPEVVVGYSQRYAVYVHENLDALHKKGRTAKYLEGPARSMKKQLAAVVTETMQKTGNLEKALLKAGLLLQRESQKIVPVDTGALRASAYTALKKDAEQKAIASIQKWEKKQAKKKEKWNDEWFSS